jgi:hypothetical protein
LQHLEISDGDDAIVTFIKAKMQGGNVARRVACRNTCRSMRCPPTLHTPCSSACHPSRAAPIIGPFQSACHSATRAGSATSNDHQCQALGVKFLGSNGR